MPLRNVAIRLHYRTHAGERDGEEVLAAAECNMRGNSDGFHARAAATPTRSSRVNDDDVPAALGGCFCEGH